MRSILSFIQRLKPTLQFLIALPLYHIPIRFIIGASNAFFSAAHIAAPLMSLWTGPYRTAAVWLIHILTSACFHLDPLHNPASWIQAYHIPTACASLFLSCTLQPRAINRLGKIFAVLVCISMQALFLLHPVGREAWIYSTYWCIPLICVVYLPHNRYGQMLTATFLAHAIGSVQWLWCHATLPGYWLSLLPTVAYERFSFAATMYCATECIMYLSMLYRKATSSVATVLEEGPALTDRTITLLSPSTGAITSLNRTSNRVS